MKVIQELVAYFERRGRLTGPQIQKLLDQGLLAGDAPLNMVNLCDPVGATYYFRVTGDANGSVWGTDIYTGDSSLAASAVHAGLVKVGETVIVKVDGRAAPQSVPGFAPLRCDEPRLRPVRHGVPPGADLKGGGRGAGPKAEGGARRRWAGGGRRGAEGRRGVPDSVIFRLPPTAYHLSGARQVGDGHRSFGENGDGYVAHPGELFPQPLRPGRPPARDGPRARLRPAAR